MKNDKDKNETDVLDLGLDDDIIMDEEDFLPPSAPPSVSMASFGRTKDPELSVNIRLRPENFVERPKGMPPLLSREAQKQMTELEEMKSTNRLHELSNLNGSRSSLNHTAASSRRSSLRAPSRVNFKHNFRQDQGNRSANPRDLRQMLMQTVQKCHEVQEEVKKSPGVDILLQNKAITEYVEVINKNFGPKYDMSIQKEIATMQKKPFLYACGSTKVITQDGSGIDGPKMKTLGTKSSINCRFSQL